MTTRGQSEIIITIVVGIVFFIVFAGVMFYLWQIRDEGTTTTTPVFPYTNTTNTTLPITNSSAYTTPTTEQSTTNTTVVIS